MSYRPKENRIECRRFLQLLKEIDDEVQCSAFKAKEQDLEKIMRSTERYYQEIGREYDELWYSPHAYVQHKKLYSFLRREISQLSSTSPLVLDAGCGTCEWAAIMIKRGASVVAFDQSLKMLQIGRDKSPSRVFMKNLNLVRGDLSLLPFKKRTFDGVTALFVLGHLPDDKMKIFLDELARMIKKGGWMVFADTRPHGPHQPKELQMRTLEDGREYIVYKRYFTAVELETLLEKSFSCSFSILEIDRYVICISSPPLSNRV